jgi:hypothetical protein
MTVNERISECSMNLWPYVAAVNIRKISEPFQSNWYPTSRPNSAPRDVDARTWMEEPVCLGALELEPEPDVGVAPVLEPEPEGAGVADPLGGATVAPPSMPNGVAVSVSVTVVPSATAVQITSPSLMLHSPPDVAVTCGSSNTYVKEA